MLVLMVGAITIALSACTSPSPQADHASATPSPQTQAWMDRLTVAHAYDPKTGFIVARETVPLPPALTRRSLDAAISDARPDQIVIAFATADRCAPCQQFKRDALNDQSVLDRLADARFVPTHVEVDRESALAERHLGAVSIPMTYALREGKVIAHLRGQRTAAQLLAWLDALPR